MGERLFEVGRARWLHQCGLLILTTVALAGCAVTWLSQYDSGTDDMTTALQRSTAIHAETLAGQEPPACFYANHRDFYVQQHADVGTLGIRVAAIPQNELTIAQVGELKRSLVNFESLHKLASNANRCMTAGEVETATNGLNAIFGAILKLEIAKLRGDRPT